MRLCPSSDSVFFLDFSFESSGEDSSSVRSNFTRSLLPRRKPFFQDSARCQACWADSSLPAKSKIRMAWDMNIL